MVRFSPLVNRMARIEVNATLDNGRIDKIKIKCDAQIDNLQHQMLCTIYLFFIRKGSAIYKLWWCFDYR